MICPTSDYARYARPVTGAHPHPFASTPASTMPTSTKLRSVSVPYDKAPLSVSVTPASAPIYVLSSGSTHDPWLNAPAPRRPLRPRSVVEPPNGPMSTRMPDRYYAAVLPPMTLPATPRSEREPYWRPTTTEVTTCRYDPIMSCGYDQHPQGPDSRYAEMMLKIRELTFEIRELEERNAKLTSKTTVPPQSTQVDRSTTTSLRVTTSTATQTSDADGKDPPKPPTSPPNRDPPPTKEPPKTEETKVKPNSSSRSSRQYIKLGYYNGKTAVEAFVRKFEVCAENNEWTEKEKLNQLTCALTEPANQLLWEFDSETVMTSSDLIRKLRARYGGSDQTALYQTQLSTRRQKDGEDLGTLVQDVRRLMILGFPGPTTIHSEAIAIRSFLDALRDQDLAMKVREREPETLDNTYNLAMRFEGYQKAARKEATPRDRRPSRVNAAHTEERDWERFRQLIREELELQQRKNASSDSRQRWGNARGGRMMSGYRRPTDATSWPSTKT